MKGITKRRFFLVESRRNEQPHLVKNEGRSQNRAADQRDLQIKVQRVHGVREDQRLADVHERCLDEADEPVVKSPNRNEADGEKNGRANDALAQLVQVLHQAHARQLGALGHSSARPADCVFSIKHDQPPRRRRLRRGCHLRGVRRRQGTAPSRRPSARLVHAQPADPNLSSTLSCPAWPPQPAHQLMAAECAEWSLRRKFPTMAAGAGSSRGGYRVGG